MLQYLWYKKEIGNSFRVTWQDILCSKHSSNNINITAQFLINLSNLKNVFTSTYTHNRSGNKVFDTDLVIKEMQYLAIKIYTDLFIFI